MIRVAATADVHYGKESDGKLGKYLSDLNNKADLLLIGGDLTQVGAPEEAQALAKDLAQSPVPTVAIFGNHDFHMDKQDQIAEIIENEGQAILLEKSSIALEIRGISVGIFGMKGFGGGFQGACCSDFGEPETKNFVRHTKELARILCEGLTALKTEIRIVLLHYSPTAETLHGERKEIYPFLGSYLLAEAIDKAGADVVFHGHAHKGSERGETPGGIPVRNVAQPVIQHAYNIYSLSELRSLRKTI